MKVPDSTPGQLADYHWLTSEAAVPFLTRCQAHTGELTRLVTSLRKELSAERAHLVIEQVELRHRAKEKFARANEMFFTRKGLEQATDEAIAEYKATRLSNVATRFADVCCGIGGDLLALSRHGLTHGAPAIGVDLDPVTAHLASENHLRILGSTGDIRVEDANNSRLDQCGAIHIDPDRRADGQRHTRFEDLLPGTDFLAAHPSQTRLVKLAPATEVPEALAAQGERTWIGSRGECRQQWLWLRPDEQPFECSRVAVVVGNGGDALLIVSNQFPSPLEMATEIGSYVYEPHPAILAAGLAGELAAMICHLSADSRSVIQARGLTIDGGYLTGEQSVRWPGVDCFQVTTVLPFDVRRLKSYFKERHVGRLEIKKRGIDSTPEQIRKQLAPQGDASATLFVARRSAGQVVAIVAERL